MFTPQRKAPWTPVNSLPRTPSRTSSLAGSQSTAVKGKAVAYVDGPPTPLPSSAASENVGKGLGLGFENGSSEDWRRFKEAGLLDESVMENKDRQALVEKISRLERELFHHQHNMGLLLIEKNDLVSKNEILERGVAEAQEIVKREQAAHLIAMSDGVKRRDNLKKAFEIEKKHILDLERALCDKREEYAKVKVTSESTAADANARLGLLEQKHREIELESHSAYAKLAEAEGKTFKLDMKLPEFEARENILQRESLTLTQELEAHELYFRKQKEDLLQWEKKLQEAEKGLCDSRRVVIENDEKLQEADKTNKDKENDLDEMQRKIGLANVTLKNMEDDIRNQLAKFGLKEKKDEAMKSELEMKEKKLKEKEERLTARETLELPKILDKHKAKLDAEMHEFELKMEQKRKSVMLELIKGRMQEVDQKEAEINHLEVELHQREQTQDMKSEMLKEIEKDIEGKFKALNEQQKCLRAEEKGVQAEKKRLDAEEEELANLREKVELLRADTRKQELQLEDESKRLDNAEEERSEYLRLQFNLKQEMEDVRHQNELIDKETVELRLERDRFGKDWEALDEKGAGVNKELELLAEKKQNSENLRISEEERLKKAKAGIEERFQLLLEGIRVEKESCHTAMEREKKMLAEHAENEQNFMLQDFEQQRQSLENDMLQRQKEWEEIVEEKERAFEEMRLKELRNISDLKKDSEKRKDELEAERCCMEKERQEMELNQKHLEENTIEIFKDIQALDSSSQKLKNQREQLMSESACFSALIDKVKSCQNCRYSMETFLHHDLQLPPLQKRSLARHSLNEVKDAADAKEKVTAGVNMGISNLGGPISVFRKCGNTNGAHMLLKSEKVNARARTTVNDERGPLVGLVNDSSKNFQTGGGVGKEKVDNASSVDSSIVESEIQDIESLKSDSKGVRGQSGRKHGPGLHATSGHKRPHSLLSRLSESEQNVDNRNGKTDSVTTGGRRKRQQTAPGQSRYNFRRCRIAGTAAARRDFDGKSQYESQFFYEFTNPSVMKPNYAPTQSLEVTAESGRRSNLVQASIVKSTKFSSDKIGRFDKTANHAVESIIDEVKSAENSLLSGEANCAETTLLTSENVGDHDDGIIFNQDDDNGDDDDDDDQQPGQSPMGKLWRFFTT